MNKSQNKTITDDLVIYFVVKYEASGESSMSSKMQVGYETAREYFPHEKGLQIISEARCMQLANKNTLTKKHIFILEEFKGDVFDFLVKTPALILGIMCLMSCFLDDTPVPLGSSPVFTAAMKSLVISASGLTADQKTRIQQLVSWMGGHYIQHINMACTHLVANTVKSTKYEKAAETKSIKIMHPDWIDDVWRSSMEQNILATDKLYDKHCLPIFYQLVITSTGLKPEVKNNLKELIIAHGGRYEGAFQSETTDILLLENDHANSAKYAAALRYKKDSLNPKWVYDSVEKGYAIAMSNYRVVARKTKQSTPTKLCNDPNFTLNCTDMSEISHLDKNSVTINETCNTGNGLAEFVTMGRSTRSSSRVPPLALVPKHKEMIEGMNIEQYKKSGQFLDGCCVFIAGFKSAEKDKLLKILNNASCIWYDELNDKVTHVIVGEPTSKDLKSINENRGDCVIVTIDWIQESMKQKCPAAESSFIYIETGENTPEPPSPSSKKVIDSMSKQFKKPNIPKFNLDAPQLKPIDDMEQRELDENDIVGQYLQKNNVAVISTKNDAMPAKEDASRDEPTFLANIKLCIFGFDKEEEQQLEEDCRTWGAEFVSENFTDYVDYLIVPIIIEHEISKDMLARNIVNDLWIEDSVTAMKCVDIEYYHKPVVWDITNRLLSGVIFVISNYTGNERVFLAELGKSLGADVQEVYDRTKKPILMCPKPEGHKYTASKKWNLPSVTCEWLLECKKNEQKMPLDLFLTGHPIILPNVSHIIPSTQPSNDCIISSPATKKRKSDEMLNDNDIPNKFPLKSVKPTFATPTGVVVDDGMSPATRRVKDFKTPVREFLYKSWKEREIKESSKQTRLEQLLQTPGTERDCNTPPIPKLPEHLNTPEPGQGFCSDSSPFSRKIHRSQMEILNNYYLPVQKSKPTTPFSEIRKRFWRGVLGDKFNEDDIQSQEDTQVTASTDDLQPPPLEPTQASSSSAAHVQQLRDFIKNRTLERRSYEPEEDVDSIPFKTHSEELLETENERIGWQDPTEFNRLRRNPDTMKYQGIPHFLISCSNYDLKEKVIQQIKQLNGEVCNLNVRYDTSCTHVLCEQPNRGEKIFSGIASGKWILSLKYIEDSVNAGAFKDENAYEWGNPNAMDLSDLEEQEKLIARAAHRWRTTIANQPEKKSGVFTGFRVILHVVKKDQFQSLIKAGGGVVIDAELPYRNSGDALQATHCFVEPKKLKLDRDDYRAFVEAGIRVFSVMYLNAYLVQESQDNFAKYEISFQ